MDAKIKKIQINPAVIDKKTGEISKDECATLTFEVPLDTMTAKKEIMALFSYLTTEFVKLDVSSDQLPIDDVKTEGASINRGQVEAQLKTLTGESK